MTEPDNRNEVMPVLTPLLQGQSRAEHNIHNLQWIQRDADWRVHTSIVEALQQQLAEAQTPLQRLHDRLDDLNSEMATVSRLCVLCRASGYDSEGIIHSLDCPLVLIRKCLKETPWPLTTHYYA